MFFRFNQWNNLKKFIPKYTAIIFNSKDNETYMIISKNLSLLMRFIVSKEKAEKVVKDPKKPIIKKFFIAGSSKILWSLIVAVNKPIKKEPKMFTNNVP